MGCALSSCMLEETLKEIDGLLGRVNTHPEYSRQVQTSMTKSLLDEAMMSSALLESLAMEKLSKGQQRPDSRVVLKHLGEAEEYLFRHGLNLTTLAVLGNLVEPDIHKYKNFRVAAVINSEFAPPEAERVPHEVENLLYRIYNLHTLHPIARAIDAHIDIVRIQIAEDGNKRIARLVQNYLLQERSYPPAIIPGDEWNEYWGLLKGTLRDRYKQQSDIICPSTTELAFHEYIAKKILYSTNALVVELKKRRMYAVSFRGTPDKGMAIAIARTLRGFGRKGNGHGLTVTMTESSGKQKKHGLEIMGDISREDVKGYLDTCAERYGLTYTLVSKIN